MVLEGNSLGVRDFSPFRAISLWVKNAGPDDAELSLAVWDKDGNRSFPIPSTFTIKAGGWQQIVARLALDGLDATQIDSVHFYQKANRQPVTLLIADVELLSPLAGRLADRIQATRAAINSARANATALGAKDQIDPQIAALAHGLDQLESSAAINTASGTTDRLMDLARISAEAEDLAKAIRIYNGGKEVVLTGPLVKAEWLSDPEKMKLLVRLTLSNTSVGDEIFPFLAPAKDLEVMFLDSRKITGAGIGKLTSEKLRRVVLSSSGATDDGAEGHRKVYQHSATRTGRNKRHGRCPRTSRRAQEVKDPDTRRHPSERHGHCRDRETYEPGISRFEADADSCGGRSPPREFDKAQDARSG